MRRLLHYFGMLLGIAAMSATAQAAGFRTVVIDPGHGGHDRGGVWGRVYEKHLCLDTATRLQAYLHAKGVRTVMTRDGDYFVSLAERVAITARQRNAIFVAIHYNDTYKADVSGFEVFYSRPDSQPLSQSVHRNVLRRVSTNDRGSKFARYYVIRNAPCPAILVECGFVSSNTERDRMKSAWWRDAVAHGIADGIMQFRNY